ncbi:TniQ family protein [Comamonas thiooxydans]|uniref:TniQ family protein n=1 Tax=Comamonas thiooxydans TaxID=363952 RepID=UPI00244B274E|nr:TniQ family protein [Comamonas thiooxydans]MDH1475224.1 TniQ family protein [Comamonas thiooxydans]
MGLIITYAPHDDESGMGYYRRLSADNALFGWRNLAGAAGVERQRRTLMMRTDDVANKLGLDPAWAELARSKEELCHDWSRLHRTQSDAICPACMAESPYLRHYWEHAYVTACPKHHIQLVDQCNACGEQLSPARLYVGLCSCGHELASIPQTPATRAQIWLSTLVASQGEFSSGMKPVLKGIGTDVLVKVIRTLCLYADPLQPALPRSYALPKTVAAAIEFLAPLEILLSDWPMNFRSHVEQRIASGRKDGRTLNTQLGDWYISLRKTCQGTALEPLLQVIIDVAAEKSECVLGLDSAKLMAQDTTQYVRASDAAKAIGVSISRMHDAVHSGECEHRSRRMGTRGQTYEIPRAEVERIQQQRDQWISDTTACELLGITPAVLGRMKSAEVLDSDVRWREDLLKGGPVKRQSIADLYARVSGWAQSSMSADDATITWAEFTSRRLGENRAIESLMKAIANGEIKPIKRARTLGEMSFLMTDVSKHFGTPLLEAGMSIQQLSKVTGWKWESIAHWLDEGLLDCESIELRGQRCRVVLPQQLQAFRQSYIPLADLAHAMGKKSSTMSLLLNGIELVGAKTLPSGAQRGALLRMSDLGRLALIGAKAGHDMFVPVVDFH